MKRILYLLFLLLGFAGCKRQEDDAHVRFTKITFVSKSDLRYRVEHDHKNYIDLSIPIAVTYGENKLEFYKQSTGEKVLDTVLNVTGPETYYILQSDTTQRPTLIQDPIVNEPAAPAGYMKIKIANEAQFIFPYQKVDVVVYSVTDYDSMPIDTLKGIGATYSKDYFLVKRDVLKVGNTASLQVEYEFGFINSITGEPIIASGGDLFKGGYYFFTLKPANVFVFSFKTVLNPIPDFNYVYLEKGGKFYGVETNVLFSK